MTTDNTRLKDLLRKNNYSTTHARLQLFLVLQNHNTLTIHELISRLPRQDQSSVYRNIKLFESLGIVKRLQLGWKSKLELSDVFAHHHHHLSCTKCGKVLILAEDKLIENRLAELGQQTAFKITDHQLEVRGLCPNCQS